ncbi:MAG: YihY/virulence factor BrkB family protein [Chloroflexi bacterium]|nr:YihY/virulence factor BrkB family protein [Chloroflexota bacterium]
MILNGITLLRLALMDFSRNNSPYMAAGMAYWALFSLFPLALATIAILAYRYPNPEDQEWIVQNILRVMPISRDYLAQVIQDVSQGRGALSILAIIGLLWTGTAVFSAVRKGINHAWHIGRPPYFLLERATDFAMLLGVAVLAFIMVAFTTNLVGLSTLANAPAWIGGGLLGKLLLEMSALAVTLGVFLLLYRFVPNTRVEWRDVWFGAVFGAILFQAIRVGFAWFVVRSGSFNLVYGVLGSLMAALVWAYLASLALMWGAQVCFAYSRLFGSHQAEGIPSELVDSPKIEAPGRKRTGPLGVVLTLIGWLLPPRRDGR